MWTLTKGDPSKRDFNNKVGRGMCVWMSVSLLPWPLLSLTIEHRNRRPWWPLSTGIEGEAQQHGLQLTKANLATTIAEYSSHLPYWQCICQNCHLWAYRMPTHHPGIYTAFPMTKEINSQPVKCSHGACLWDSLTDHIPCWWSDLLRI